MPSHASIIGEIHDARQELLAGRPRHALAMLLRLENRMTPGGLRDGLLRETVWDTDEDPDSLENLASFRLVRAECHYALRDHRRAAEDAAQALKAAPNSPRAELLLQLAGEMLELERSMRPVPTGVERLADRALRSPEPDLNEAVTAFVTAPSANPEEPGIDAEQSTEPPAEEAGLVSETLANILVLQGKYEEARKVYIQLARLHPERFDHFQSRLAELATKIAS